MKKNNRLRPMRPFPNRPRPNRDRPQYKPRLDIIPMHFNLDTDRDGVPDWRDCQPFDSTRQHKGPSEMTYTDYPDLYKILLKHATKRYNGGIKELKGASTKIVSRYLEHDKSRKSRIPFPNIPQIANIPHDRYEVDVKWEVHEVPLGSQKMTYLLYLYDKAKRVLVYYLIIMPGNTPSVYEFNRTPDQKQYVFYPEPDWEFLFAFTEEDREKMNEKDFKDFVYWVITQKLQG